MRWNEPFPQAHWQGPDLLPAALGHSLPGLRNVRGGSCSLLRRHASCGLYPDAELPRDESSPGSLRREALLLPGPLSPPVNPASVPETCSAHSSALCPAGHSQAAPAAPGPLSALLPLSPGTRLSSITPGPFLPLGLRRVSRLCEFPGSSRQSCRRTRKPDSLREFTIRPLPCCRAPVNPLLSAPATFIMPGISTPGAPPTPLRSLRAPQAAAAPIRPGRAVMRSAPGFLLRVTPAPSGWFPAFPRPAAQQGDFPLPAHFPDAP